MPGAAGFRGPRGIGDPGWGQKGHAAVPGPGLRGGITRSFWMDRMRLRAASQLALLPVMTMVSELLFSAGRSILVLLSSRIWKPKGHGEMGSALALARQGRAGHLPF